MKHTVTASHPFVRRVSAVVLVVAASLLALSACAPPVPVPTPSGGSTSSVTPTPTPTAAGIAPPKVRIPLTCDDLAPSATLNTAMGATMTTADLTAAPDLSAYVGVQDGALNCSWNGPVVSGQPVASYTILAIPDASSIWAKDYADGIKYDGKFPTSFVGQVAYGNCYSNNDPGDKAQGCNVDLLDGSVWLNFQATTSAVPGSLTDSQLRAEFGPLLKSAVDAITGVTVAEPAWSDPTASPVTLPIHGGTVADPAFKTAIGTTFVSETSSPYFDINGAMSAEMIPVGYRMDGGDGAGAGGTVTPAKNYGMTISILPSGGWAFDQIKTAAAGNPDFTALTGLGSEAFSYSNPAKGFGAFDSVIVGVSGHNLYVIEVGDNKKPGQPDPLVLAKAAATYVLTELGS